MRKILIVIHCSMFTTNKVVRMYCNDLISGSTLIQSQHCPHGRASILTASLEKDKVRAYNQSHCSVLYLTCVHVFGQAAAGVVVNQHEGRLAPIPDRPAAALHVHGAQNATERAAVASNAELLLRQEISAAERLKASDSISNQSSILLF